MVSAGLDGTAMMWDTTGQAKDEEEDTVMRGVRALSAPVLGLLGIFISLHEIAHNGRANP